MSKMSEIHAKAEAVLMGMTQHVESMGEAEILVGHILSTFKATGLQSRPTAQEVLKSALQYSPDKTIAYIGTSVLMEQFRVINLVLKGKTAKTCRVTSQDGALAYCYNLDAPDLSELGYMWFKQTPRGLKRVS